MNVSRDHELPVSDGELAALFAPEPARTAVLGLHRWHEEIASLPLRISEPMIGSLRLAWHREAVEALFETPQSVRRNPVIEGLASAVNLPGGPTMDEILRILDVYEADFEGAGFSTVDALTARAEATDGAVLTLAARLLDAEAGAHNEALHAAGRSCGLTRLVRQFAARAARGYAAVPEDALQHAGLTAPRLATGREPKLARAVVAPLQDAAEQADRQARALCRQLPVGMFPAVAPAALCRIWLRRSRRATDPYRPGAAPPVLSRQLRLIASSLFGRI